VRSQLEGLVSRPRAIAVRAEQGHVTLSGPVLRDETNSLLKGVAAVRGVCAVGNQLDVYDEPGNISGLQGQSARRRSSQRWDVMQRHWSPPTRLLIGATGGALATYGAGRRDPLGSALGLSGLTLLARAITNIGFKRLLGVGANGHAIDIRKTITIEAPVERVFGSGPITKISHISCPMCAKLWTWATAAPTGR
jgi:hypothetical protein